MCHDMLLCSLINKVHPRAKWCVSSLKRMFNDLARDVDKRGFKRQRLRDGRFGLGGSVLGKDYGMEMMSWKAVAQYGAS